MSINKKHRKTIQRSVSIFNGLLSVISIVPVLYPLSIVSTCSDLCCKLLFDSGLIKDDIESSLISSLEETIVKAAKRSEKNIFNNNYRQLIDELKDCLKHKVDNSKTVIDSTLKLNEIVEQSLQTIIKYNKNDYTKKDIENLALTFHYYFVLELTQNPDIGILISQNDISNLRLKILNIEDTLEYLSIQYDMIERKVDEFISKKHVNSTNNSIDFEFPSPALPIKELIGRDCDYNKLTILLNSNRNITFLWGTEGVGKSELCKYFLFKENLFENTIWLDYSTNINETLFNSIDFEMSNKDNIQNIYIKLRNYIRKLDKNKIIVFNNYNSPQQEDMDFLLTIKCKVILLSCDLLPAYNNIFNLLEIKELSINNCYELFLSYSNKTISNKSIVKKICTKAGRNTYLIMLLAKCYSINPEYQDITDLYKQLKEINFDFSKIDVEIYTNNNLKKKSLIGHIKKIFNLSRVYDDTVKDILSQSCVVLNSPIIETKAVELLNIDNNIPSYAKAILGGWLTIEQYEDSSNHVRNKVYMKTVSCIALQELLSPSYSKLSKVFIQINLNIGYSIDQIEIFNPIFFLNAIQLGNYARKKNIFNNEVELLFYNIGHLYLTKGNSTDSIPWLKQSELICENVNTVSQIDMIKTYSDLSLAFSLEYKFDAAIKYFKLALQDSSLDDESVEVLATVHNNIGLMFSEASKFDLSIYFYKETLDILKEHKIKESFSLSTVYNNLGEAYLVSGQYKKSIKSYKKALKIRKSVNKKHPYVAVTYGDLGLVYVHIGKYKKAYKLFMKSLELMISTLNDEQIYLATLYNNLGFYYDAIGNNHLALKWYKKSLDSSLKILGSDHPDIAVTLINIGSIYSDLNLFLKAKDYYIKSLDICNAIFKEESRITANTYDHLGYCLFEIDPINNYKNSLFLCCKGMKMRERLLGTNHVDTGTSYTNVGLILLSRKKNKAAINLFYKDLSISLATFNNLHINNATIYNNLALAYSSKDFCKSVSYYKKCIKITSRNFGFYNADNGFYYYNLGVIYYNKSLYNISLKYLNKALTIRKRVLEKNDVDLAITYCDVASVYFELDLGKKSISNYKKSYLIFNQYDGYKEYKEDIVRNLNELKK